MAYIDPDDYWAQIQWNGQAIDRCPACGMVIPQTEEGILDHAERLFVWPDEVLEDILDSEYVSE